MITQDDLRCPDAQVLEFASASQFSLHRVEVIEKRFDELVKLIAGGRELEGPSLEEGQTQGFFQLNDLAAHRRLLDAIRHVTHGFADAAVFRYVVEKLEVMNVHGPARVGWPDDAPRGLPTQGWPRGH